jgi:hypothetical protein
MGARVRLMDMPYAAMDAAMDAAMVAVMKR